MGGLGLRGAWGRAAVGVGRSVLPKLALGGGEDRQGAGGGGGVPISGIAMGSRLGGRLKVGRGS